jgi:glucan phosphoethanolaminetransferase (alkaline phosphatase superfamily)
MPESVPNTDAEFVYRRTTGSFAGFVSDIVSAFSPWWLFAALAAAFIGYFILRAVGIRFDWKWRKPVAWILGLGGLGLFIFNMASIETGKSSTDTNFDSDLFSVGNKLAWYVFVSVVLALGLAFIVWQYIRDARTIKAWAIPLAACRFGVYVILAYCFLQPAIQEWQTVEKKSKVILVVDISPSLATVSDDIASAGTKPKTRLDKVLDTLTDDKLALVKNLLVDNPVTIYRFGARLDDEP